MRPNQGLLHNSRFSDPVKADFKHFGAIDISETSPLKVSSVDMCQGRHNFNIRKADGTITTIKRIGSSKDSGKIAIGFSSGNIIFTDLNQVFKKEYQGFSLKEECYKLHSSSVNSMEVAMINFKDVPANSREKKTGLRKILLTGGSESECSIIVWDLESRKAMKRLSGHKHQISCIIDLKDYCHVASASFDSRVAIWDISNNFVCKKLLDCRSSPILSLHYNSSMNQLLAGYMDGTINVWKTDFKEESPAIKAKAAGDSDSIKIKHIMEMTMSSHILKLELVKCDPFDMLLILGSDF